MTFRCIYETIKEWQFSLFYSEFLCVLHLIFSIVASLNTLHVDHLLWGIISEVSTTNVDQVYIDISGNWKPFIADETAGIFFPEFALFISVYIVTCTTSEKTDRSHLCLHTAWLHEQTFKKKLWISGHRLYKCGLYI